MWDELNRILGVNRKSELSSGEPRPDASAAPEAEPGTKSGNVSDLPGDRAPAALPREPEVPEPARTVEPQSSPDEIAGDGETWPAGVAAWAAILDEESGLDGDLGQWDSSALDDALPAANDGLATESAEPRPFGFALPHATRRKPAGRRLVKPEPGADKTSTYKPQQRLLILDCWQRSGLPAKDFADLVGISKHTLYGWKKTFMQYGPAGLMDRPRGAKPGSRLPDLTQRSILMLKQDDHSRFIVSFGLHASQSTALVLEVLRAGITSYGAPREVLTDNGSQYVTWRGKSLFTKELEKRGIVQVVARPRHPQTLGKIERFWGTLWRECLEAAVFIDLADARARIGHFIDWYNFRRPHSGIDSLAPADRFFGAAPDVLRALRGQVAANALELARNGVPRPPFYVTGQVGGKNFSLHAEGERVFLTQEGQQRREVDLAPPASATTNNAMPPPVCPDGSPATEETTSGTDSDEPAPGTSPLDDFLPPRGESDAPADPQPGTPAGENGGAP